MLFLKNWYRKWIAKHRRYDREYERRRNNEHIQEDLTNAEKLILQNGSLEFTFRLLYRVVVQEVVDLRCSGKQLERLQRLEKIQNGLYMLSENLQRQRL